MTKTAKQILFEHGINIMELNDDFNTQLLHAMEEYASQPSAGLEIDTFPFCERGGKWFYCYKDIKGLNQHSKLFDSWGEAIQSYNEWHFVKADDIPTPSAGLGDVKLPDFLYKSGNEICIGYHGDSLVTDEWNEWLEKHLPKLKALTSLPSGIDTEVEKYINDFFKYSEYRGEYTIQKYGGSLIIKFKDGSKAKLQIGMWQGAEVTLDSSTSTIDARDVCSRCGKSYKKERGVACCKECESRIGDPFV